MSKQLFEPEWLTQWNDLLDTRKPRPIEEIEWTSFPQIEAIRPVALNCGIAFRLATRNGPEIEFVINPVAARHLAACILKMGQEAGWLTEGADVVNPPRPLLDS